MKVFVCALIAMAVIQISYAQVIRTIAGPLLGGNPCGGPIIQAPVIQSAPLISQANPLIVNNNNVAASLADTLSLLTVSSLLADTLPLGANVIGLPVGGCGCGGGYYY